uniref:Excision repair cross-complementation group 5 n=1 Tax=Amphiprion percula TaxID=161767 RepID=A0A3P8U2B3_AMPPE
MSQRSAGSAPQLYQEDGDQQSHSVESQRLVSEDHSHYILIKGSNKNESAPESQPAVSPWSGSSLSGCRIRAADKPKPLWRPICEEDEEVQTTSSEDSKPSVSKPSVEATSPPSPRTVKAIQAAMNDSSDEEKVDQRKEDGSVSPRTLLAIQQALNDEEDGAAECMTRISSSPIKVKADVHHPVPQVFISSSEEETEPSPKGTSDFKRNPAGQSSDVKDSLLVSSSEDEMEEVIGERNRALRLATLQQRPRTEMESEEETKTGHPMENLWTKNRGQTEKKEKLNIRESDHSPHNAAASSPDTLSINLSPQLCGKPASARTDIHPVTLKQSNDKLTEAPEETNGDNVKSESSEESESEESFIEVSEEEFKKEDTDDSVVITGEKEATDEVHKDGIKKEEESEESLTETPGQPAAVLNLEEDKKTQNEGLMEETETESRPTDETPAINEWEHIDVDELEALESSLQVEQSNLREQKQQQERMANTVTGQMYLESQELLRLFGMPFLVAPTEAEAQCAALDRADQTNGTITDDSDVWLFGGRHVYKNFFSQNKYVEHYQYSDLQNQLGLDRTKMINLAYLLGSDYTEGIPGVGYVTGMEILNEFPGPGLEPLTQFSTWWSEAQEKKRLVADPRDTKVKKKLRDLILQPGFPNPAVAQAYLQPAVDQSDSSFSWGRPQLDMIKEYPCTVCLGLSVSS